jgi:hypothetical protein
VHLQYVYYLEAACKAGLLKQTTSDVKKRAKALKATNEAQGLPPLTFAKQVAKKERSRAKLKIIDDKVIKLLKACTLNKNQRKKL